MNINELIKTKNATLVDVRSTEEVEEIAIPGAVNIPLHTIPVRLEEFKSMNGPVICFCRSGARSHQATAWLRQHGIDAHNGGGYEDVMDLINV